MPERSGTYTYRLDAEGRDGLCRVRPADADRHRAAAELALRWWSTNWTLRSYYDGVGAQRGLLEGTTITAVFGTNGIAQRDCRLQHL